MLGPEWLAMALLPHPLPFAAGGRAPQARNHKYSGFECVRHQPRRRRHLGRMRRRVAFLSGAICPAARSRPSVQRENGIQPAHSSAICGEGRSHSEEAPRLKPGGEGQLLPRRRPATSPAGRCALWPRSWPGSNPLPVHAATRRHTPPRRVTNDAGRRSSHRAAGAVTVR